MLAKELTYDQGKEGLRVQDYWGHTGTIRWKGKLAKSDKPPHGAVGHYFFVEFDEGSDDPLRSDGTWNNKRYCQCDARHGLMSRAHNFLPEINDTAVKMLREHFGDKVATWHDFELVKFCIARRFEMKKVIAMLTAHLEWRETFKPSAEEYFPPEMAVDYPCGYSNHTDFDGNLIYCERPGKGGFCSPADFVRKYTLPRIGRWHACGVEMGIQRLRATNYRSKRMCYIVDFLKVNALSRPMIGFAQTFAQVEQDNYPENVGRVLIINCPTVVRLAWRLIKSFLDERTNRKIVFVSPGKAVEAMKEVMREEYIPDFAGGTCDSWFTSNNGVLGSNDPSKVCSDLSPLPSPTGAAASGTASEEGADGLDELEEVEESPSSPDVPLGNSMSLQSLSPSPSPSPCCAASPVMPSSAPTAE